MTSVSGKSYSILQRLTVALTLAVGIVSAITIVILALVQTDKGREALERDATKSVASLAQLLDRPLWDFDTDRAVLIGNVFLDDPRVIELNVRESSGKQLIAISRGDTSDAIHRTAPVTHKDKLLGEVTVSFSRSSYVDPAWHQAGVSAFVCMFVILTIFITTRLLIRTYLRVPLDELSQVVNAYSAGDYAPASDRIPYAEFKPFASLLGRMGQQIQAQVEELRARSAEQTTVNTRLESEIAERSRTERELKISQTMLEQVLNSAPLQIWWKDTQGVYLGCNSVFINLAQVKSSADVIGKTDFDLRWPREDAEKYRNDDQRVIAAGKPQVGIIEHVEMSDGSRHWVSTSKAPLRDAAGQIYGVLGVCEDITIRKMNEDLLQQERDFSNALINSLPGVLYLLDQNGKFVRVNENHRHVFGYADSEYAALHALDLVAPEDRERVAEKTRLVFEKGPDAVEAFGMRKDGSKIPFLLTGAKVMLDGKPFLVGVGIDITERKRVEAELEQHRNNLEELVRQRTEALRREIAERMRIEEALRDAKEAAEAANAAKSTFLASMSHEIRTPLNAILGYSHLLKRDENLTQKNHQAISAISKSGEHLLDLISDILAMSKIEAGRTTLDSVDFDLFELLRSLESMFGLRVQEKGLRFVLEIGSNLPQFIRTDQRKLRQVLFNLLSNAVRFTTTGTIMLRARQQSRTDSGGAQARLEFEVTDTGVGISAAEQAALFEPFAQTESGRRVSGGAGLGLAISRGFVELMGGTVNVRSGEGTGSTFTFTITAKIVDHPTVLPSSGEIVRLRLDSGANDGKPPRILVVDDHADSRSLLSDLLNSAGFETRQAANGEEAVASWESWRPQLIWMDMNMPLVDGYQATRTIRQKDVKQETKIVALTASVFEEDRDRIIACGCVDCLPKPYREDAIFSCLEKYLNVQYERREKPALAPRAVTIDEVAAKFRDLDAPTRERIAYATRTLDAQALLEIVASIQLAHPVVAKFLARTAEQLDFDVLHQLVTAPS